MSLSASSAGFKEGAAIQGPTLVGATASNYGGGRPPTPAMKSFADSICRHKGIKPPSDYATSGTICRTFLNLHAPKKTNATAATGPTRDATNPLRNSSAAKVAEESGFIKSRNGRLRSGSTSEGTRCELVAKPGRRTTDKKPKSAAPKSAAPAKTSRKRKDDRFGDAAAIISKQNAATDTPLRIPYGNKEIAVTLGARYRSGGWYAPPGIDLAKFNERGWL
jgi:DNA topoisomerase-3